MWFQYCFNGRADLGPRIDFDYPPRLNSARTLLLWPTLLTWTHQRIHTMIMRYERKWPRPEGGIRTTPVNLSQGSKSIRIPTLARRSWPWLSVHAPARSKPPGKGAIGRLGTPHAEQSVCRLPVAHSLPSFCPGAARTNPRVRQPPWGCIPADAPPSPSVWSKFASTGPPCAGSNWPVEVETWGMHHLPAHAPAPTLMMQRGGILINTSGLGCLSVPL